MNIQAFMQGYKAAWEQRDPAMFAALFQPDGGRCAEARIWCHSMPQAAT